MLKTLRHALRLLRAGKSLKSLAVGEAYWPYGEDFGLAIIPDFVQVDEETKLKEGYFDIYSRHSEKLNMNDGRLELPALPPRYFEGLLMRLEQDALVPPGWLNYQSAYLYRPGDFVRAHVDNLFLYDDVFATFSLGANALMRFVHIQHGEELDVMVPGNSLYILSGPARYVYFHMVLPLEAQRIAFTLRRAIVESENTFRPIRANPLAQLMPYRALQLLKVLQGKQIGSVRIAVAADDFLTQDTVGAFDTARWVQRLKPLNDWSLGRQLDEDAARLDELRQRKLIDVDLQWRLKELRTYFAAIEAALTAAPPPHKSATTAAEATQTPADK